MKSIFSTFVRFGHKELFGIPGINPELKTHRFSLLLDTKNLQSILCRIAMNSNASNSFIALDNYLAKRHLCCQSTRMFYCFNLPQAKQNDSMVATLAQSPPTKSSLMTYIALYRFITTICVKFMGRNLLHSLGIRPIYFMYHSNCNSTKMLSIMGIF